MSSYEAKHFSIRSSARARGRVCPITREHVNSEPGLWCLSIGYGLLSPAGIEQAPAELKEMLAELLISPPPDAEVDFAIIALDLLPDQKYCFLRWQDDSPIWRGEGAKWGVGTANGAVRLLSDKSAWELCPTLAGLLHRRGHLPARPAPVVAPPKPKPVPATRDEIRADAIRRATLAMVRGGPPSGADAKRAEAMLGAIQDFLTA